MAGSRALIARIVAVFALLFCAVVALRGHIPGTVRESGSATNSVPDALSVALMPVLFTVSIVVLLAGVIVGQHRLPLAMPEFDTDDTEQHWRLGRSGMVVVFLAALIGVFVATACAVYFLGYQRPTDRVPPPTEPGSEQVRPPAPPAQYSDEPPLTGAGLLLATAAAGTLVAVAVTGLVVVTVNTQRRERRNEPEPDVPTSGEPPSTDTESLMKAAEMGLAAMNAPGQDARTAIIACYVAMERGLVHARGAAPLVSDTPMEILARAFEHGALRDVAARELAALFEEARFSPHAMVEWQRMRAEQLLRVVLSDLGAPLPDTEFGSHLSGSAPNAPESR